MFTTLFVLVLGRAGSLSLPDGALLQNCRETSTMLGHTMMAEATLVLVQHRRSFRKGCCKNGGLSEQPLPLMMGKHGVWGSRHVCTPKWYVFEGPTLMSFLTEKLPALTAGVNLQGQLLLSD